jgi:hypothetical protein
MAALNAKIGSVAKDPSKSSTLKNVEVAESKKLSTKQKKTMDTDKDGDIDIFAPSESCEYDNLPFWVSQLGSISGEHFQNHNIFQRLPNFKVEKIKVVCKSLNTLIKEKNITSIDTLLIDTEGHDYTILRALDLSIIKPKNIVFENKHMDGTFKKGKNYNDLINYFTNNGYEIIKEDQEDTYLELKN